MLYVARCHKDLSLNRREHWIDVHEPVGVLLLQQDVVAVSPVHKLHASLSVRGTLPALFKLVQLADLAQFEPLDTVVAQQGVLLAVPGAQLAFVEGVEVRLTVLRVLLGL